MPVSVHKDACATRLSEGNITDTTNAKNKNCLRCVVVAAPRIVNVTAEMFM